MIDFSLSEDELLLQRTARDFAEHRLRDKMREHEREGVPANLVAEFTELGLGRIDCPEAFGGGGLSPLAQALVLEELATVDVAATLALDRTGPARYAVLRHGSEADQRALFAAKRAALVVDAPAALTIAAEGLSGAIAWSPVAAPDLVVVIRSDETLLVDGADVTAKGVRAIGLAAAGSSELVFERAPIHKRLPGDPALALAEARLYQASLLVGLGRAAYEYTAQYTQDRVAFGRPIAHHQAVAFMIVEMALATEAARLATWRAAYEIARNACEAPWAAAAALAEAAESALAMTDRGVQLLGGHGYTKDHPVEKWMREARALTLAWGGTEGLAGTLADTVAPAAP